jgi:uncharacterized protein YjbI with pentapeptide repeats
MNVFSVGGCSERFLVLLAIMLLYLVAAKGTYSENLTIVPASEILAKIQKGEPVEYDHVLVDGSLDLRNLDLPENENGLYIVTSPIIRINDSAINEGIYFCKTKFYGPLDFHNTNFKGLVDFTNTFFSTNASFSLATFDKDAYFSDTMFSRSVFFTLTMFRGPVDFNRAIFSSYAYFYNDTFGGDAYFGEATFRGEAMFSDVAFNGYSTFMGAMFLDDAVFGKSIFDEHADFSHVTFNSLAEFGGAIFSNYANFSETAFVQVNFIGATFSGNTNFKGATFGKYLNIRRNINFIGAMLDKCNLRGLKSAADFSKTTFKGYVLGWAYIKNTVFDEAAYLALINDFRDHGQFDDANDCYYTYRSNNVQDISDLFAWLTCGFGVIWQHTIKFAIYVMMIFGFIYFMGYWREGLTNAAFEQKMQSKYKLHEIAQIFLESVSFSVVALLSLPREFYPYDENKYITFIGRKFVRIPFRLLMVIERLIGWGLLVLLINTMSRVMIHY